MYKSFKAFLEEKTPYMSSTEDELGIDPRDWEKEPQIGSFFSFGKNINNIGTYKILKFKRNQDGQITHAIVKQNNDLQIKNRQYKDKDGNVIRVDQETENKIFTIPIEDIDKLMSQDFQPPPQQGIV
jgi:hypothetical protein